MANIIEKTGKSYNIFDKINNVWNKCSFWTHSNDVFYPDGKSATTKHGAINGITSDLSGEAEDIAASIKCVNQLNDSLNAVNTNLGGFTPVIDSTGKITGYKTKVGADTVFPFSRLEIEEVYTQSNDEQNYSATSASSASSNVNLTVPAGKYIVCVTGYRCTTRDSDHAMQGWSSITKPTASSNTKILSENSNYIIVESDTDITLSHTYSTSGFYGGTLTTGTRIIAFKLK